jgi:threonine synthase
LFLPGSAPRAKLVQALQYGARVFRVDGNYDLAYEMSLEYSRARGGMSRNTAFNPMTIEGKKTVSLELFKQLGRVPDNLFAACGDGCILAGIYKGFRDLAQLGITAGMPRVFAVQAETSDALYRAWKTGRFTPVKASSVADSICVDVPRNGLHALSLLRRFQGEVITVSDDAILRAQTTLSRTTGLFAEPAGTAALAGFLEASPGLDPKELTVVLTTGSGLKDIASASLGVEMSDTLIRSIDDIH